MMSNSTHVNTSPYRTAQDRTVWKFRLQMPDKQNRIFYGFWLRLITAVLAVVMSTILLMVCGIINSWQLTNGLLIFYGAFIWIVILLGEHFRLRVYERIIFDVGPTSVDVEVRPNRHSFIVAAEREMRNVQREAPSHAEHVPNLTKGITKRIFDIVSSMLALIALAPLMVLIAALIKFDSPGPIIFRQRRSGFNGEQFVIYKFRTMRALEDGPVVIQALRGDSRITRAGKFLRRSSLDELPQLFNVLKGDMSLVGPRPHAVAFDKEYRVHIADYGFRHHIRPGITGWAQVNGLRGETRSLEQMTERVKLDLWYINHWSLGFDIKIILQTLFYGVRDRVY